MATRDWSNNENNNLIRAFLANNGLLYEVNSYLKGDIYYEKSVENWY